MDQQPQDNYRKDDIQDILATIQEENIVTVPAIQHD